MKVKKSAVAGAGLATNAQHGTGALSTIDELQTANNSTGNVQQQMQIDPSDFPGSFFDDQQMLSMMPVYYPNGMNQLDDMSYAASMPYNFLLDDDDDDDDDEFDFALMAQQFNTAGPASLPPNLNTKQPIGKQAQQPVSIQNVSGSSSLPFVPNVQTDVTPTTTTPAAQPASRLLPESPLSSQPMLQDQSQQMLLDSNFVIDNTVAVADTDTLVSPMDTTLATAPTESAKQSLTTYRVTSPPSSTSDVSNASATSPQTAIDFAIYPSSSVTKPKTTTSRSRQKKSHSTPRTRTRASKASASSNAGSSRDVSPVAITPVEIITDIVADKIQDNELYKEVSSKPIKHQVEIDVEGAHNRSVKNAINARVNRQKHKQFVQTLEEENAQLKSRIEQLETNSEQLRTEKDLLQQEIHYLKSVIANDSTIGRVLQGLGTVKGVKLTSGFDKLHRKRAADSSLSSDSEQKRASRRDDVSPSPPAAGVCLHVHSDSVSVEFCDKCAKLASIGKDAAS